MTPTIYDIREAKEAFHVAHPAKESAATGGDGPSRVMRALPRIGIRKPGAGFWSAFENLVWGFAPGSTILILGLAILCARMYLNFGHHYISTATPHWGKAALAQFLARGG